MDYAQDKDSLLVKPYDKCTLPLIAHIAAGFVGFVLGFGVLWLFYRLVVMAIIGALLVVPAAIYANINMAKKRRLRRLLGQFRSMLESLVVSLQAGSADLNAFTHALDDMVLMYSEHSDIAKEAQLIITKFASRISIGESLTDFGKRCGLEDVKLFASVYSQIERKADKTSEIVIRTQKILADKIEIEEEIQTLVSGALNEINIIVMMPVFIVGVMGFMGGELMQGLFTPIGRVIATVSILMFIGAYLLGRKLVNIKV